MFSSCLISRLRLALFFFFFLRLAEGPEPDTNFHGHSSYLPIEGYLQQMLHAGPPPSGWGPYVPE